MIPAVETLSGTDCRWVFEFTIGSSMNMPMGFVFLSYKMNLSFFYKITYIFQILSSHQTLPVMFKKRDFIILSQLDV